MKMITILFISIVVLVKVSNAKSISSDLEINSATFVSVTALTAGITQNTVILNWSVKNESSNSRYEIERSFYSNKFTAISTFQVSFSSSNSIKNYRINDNASELTGRAMAYYRVKQLAANGTVTYSNVMEVNLQDAKNNDMDLSTAIKRNTAISFTTVQNGNAVIRIKSLTGQAAAVKNIIVTKGDNFVELDNLKRLSKGIYIAEILLNGVTIENQKIILEE